MFGIFKKKQPANKVIDDRSHDILRRASGMLELQLMLCKSQPKYEQLFGSNFVRGYLIGFFDAAMQRGNIFSHSDQDFFLLIAASHTYLFSGNSKKAVSFTLESMSRQGDTEFDAARRQGGGEYVAFLDGEIRNPNGLERYFHGSAASA